MRVARAPELSEALGEVLRAGVQDGTFPGGVACVGFRDQKGAARAVLAGAGRLAPEGDAVRLAGPYDLASLTKPFVATAVLRLVAQGALDLESPIARWLPEIEGTLGGRANLAALLSHRAGLSPWGGLFRDIPGPACSPETRAWFVREAATRADDDPPARGGHYSDLGYMLIGETASRAAGLSLGALVEREVTRPLGIHDEVFYAADLDDAERAAWLPAVAPTEFCAFRGRRVHGEVHDENCAAFGGVAGHAGLFGSARAVCRFALHVLDAYGGESDWLDPQLVRWAVAPRDGGGYVAGWDTPSRASSAGAHISANGFGHLGFTGTSIWCDPERHMAVVLLSNRVYETRENIQIRALRPRLHDAAFTTFDAHAGRLRGLP